MSYSGAPYLAVNDQRRVPGEGLKHVRPLGDGCLPVGLGLHTSGVDADFAEFIDLAACEPEFFA